MRARYTWHFRPPFDIEFDRPHWWKGLPDSKIDQVAALYELARRHPLVGKGLLKRMPSPTERETMYASVWKHDPTCPPAVFEGRLDVLIQEAVAKLHEPPSLSSTCRIGLKSWARLDYTERRNWEFEIGNMKGLDLRDEDLQCYSINKMAHWRITGERRAALVKKGQIDDNYYEQNHEVWEAAQNKNLNTLHNDVAVNPPTAKEWEAAIANRAVDASRRGYTLLAIAPDLKADKASSVMAKTYCDHLRFYHPSRNKQRARCENWLPIILEFENDEANSKKSKSQVFARYRRALDAIQFA